MKKMKMTISILAFIFLFVFCGKVLAYLLVDDTTWYSSSRIMMHEFYTQEENIDILFVGSSHCYRSFVPEITDKILGGNTFNAGSSSQGLDGSLALIKEAVKNNQLKQVYLEVYYMIAMYTDYEERTDMTSTYIISDYMRPSLNKLKYLLQASTKEHYINSFIPARRHWEKLFDADYIKSVVQRKNTAVYREYRYDYVTTENEYYVGKGYVASNISEAQGAYWAEEDFAPIKEEDISSDWKKSLQEIIAFCKQKNIELTLISSPMPDFRLISVENYDKYIEYIQKVTEGTGVKYYDFNLCRENWFSGEEELFLDTDHLNKRGAELFSTIFAKFCMGEILEEDLFYDSYEEKRRHLPSRIFGLIISEDVQNDVVTIKPVTNAEVERITYSVNKIPEGQKPEIFTDNRISYVKGESGILEITAFLDGNQTNFVSIQYGQK